MFETRNIMSYDIFVDNINEIRVIPEKKQIINTINAHSFVTAQEDLQFKQVLQASDILLPDGSGIVLAEKWLHNRKIEKIAGADIHQYLLEMLDKEHGSVFYVGSSPKTLDAIHARIAKEYKNIRVGSYSPPYSANFSEAENQEIISKVNAFRTDVLFVGMTAPKQEKWLQQNRAHLDFKIASSIGAVFDFYSGNVKRAPQWMNQNGLEWLHRSLRSWRLAKRSIRSNPLFIKELFYEKFR